MTIDSGYGHRRKNRTHNLNRKRLVRPYVDHLNQAHPSQGLACFWQWPAARIEPARQSPQPSSPQRHMREGPLFLRFSSISRTGLRPWSAARIAKLTAVVVASLPGRQLTIPMTTSSARCCNTSEYLLPHLIGIR